MYLCLADLTDLPCFPSDTFHSCAGFAPASFVMRGVIGATPVMLTDNDRLRELQNETVVNVAGLLKAQTEADREYRLHLDELFIDGDTVARDINGKTADCACATPSSPTSRRWICPLTVPLACE